MTGHSGIVTNDSGIVTAVLVVAGIGHDQPERPVTIDQNRRSRWARTSGHVGPEYPLFLARSPSFIQTLRQETGVAAMLYQAGKTTQRPWLVLTYLMPLEPPTCYWETACAQELDVLLDHLKQRPKAQVAELLYMSPPTLNERWTRQHISWIDRGNYEGATVYVYYLSAKGEHCLDHREIDPEDVRSRKRVLLVNWSSHFNF